MTNRRSLGDPYLLTALVLVTVLLAYLVTHLTLLASLSP